ncbi:hypothetical protein B0A69_10260 [Chryseobacterium shigense]|uniref:5-methylcytosine-specific restriction enzyme B n=1 Tax=Chryseobacterium shigense TaxID=297244 RepID=A0A1N7HXV2_9FLAO|nr:hypothetical protein [Chryseobacterium shigense]PQA93971.1 hypothetical protein B0A69_10260 [Chryseobacterium shigense]SIS29677.1 5-methylcytosine-specific restriction enzyme B [Chryseobacterium shigense]
MKLEELSEILKDKYQNAPKNERVVNIHIFGIEYGEIIKKNNYKVSQIIKLAEMKKSYTVELSKGIKLSQFAKLKSSTR